MRLRLVLLLFSFVLLIPARAQDAAPARLGIGTNLQGPMDYGTAWPFVDIMRFARPWGTQNSVRVDGGENPWDSERIGEIPLDEHGYPLEIPVSLPGTDTTQVVFTVWANTTALPTGTYTCLYDGTGTISFGFDGEVLTSEPGRITFDLGHSNNILIMRIERSDASDPVRNIRVLMPGTEATHVSDPYDAAWLDKNAAYEAIRFMDWGITNNSTLSSWQERPRRGDYTWTQHGIPYEEWAALANRLETDIWINVPHLADDEYVREMARLFRETLDPELTIYVEYTNEWWNWIFTQAHYINDEMDQSLPWPERYAPRLEHVMQLWTEVFAGQEERIVRVFASQHYWPDLTWRVLAQMENADLIDAVSPAGYVGLDGERLNTEGADATPASILANARDEFEQNALPHWRTYAEIAAQYDLQLLYYEGGQHFTPHPFGTDQPYNQALMDVQTDRGIYDLYTTLLDTLAGLGHDPVFFHFTSLGPPSGKYGSWGALSNQYMEPPYHETAPKYQALLDYMGGTSTAREGAGSASSTTIQSVAPHPVENTARIQFELQRPGAIQLIAYDLLGRRVSEIAGGAFDAGEHEVRWNAGGLAPGVYLLRLTAGEAPSTRLVVVQ